MKMDSSVTFLGHSTILISIGGTNILTDPNFSRRITFLIRRRSSLPIQIDDLPPIHLVLISHAHYDHLDLPTLKKLPKSIPVIVPAGADRVVKRAGMRQIITLSPWENRKIQNVTVTAVPAKHFPGRPPLYPRTGYQGYVIDGSAVVYFAGDTGYFEGFSEIGDKWDIDAALLPVGAYQPPPFRRHHMSPEDAVEAARRLRARFLVPIHWGAFKLSLEPFHEPIPRLLKSATEAGIRESVRILKPGESLRVRGAGEKA